VIVKKAVEQQEIEDVYKIRRIVFIDEQQVPEEEEYDEYEKEAVHIILYDDSRLPAAAGRYRVVDGIGKAERICVLKDYRKIGAGKAVMDKIEELAREQELSAVKLNAQTQAIPFYTKLGYEVVSEEFMDAGIPHRTMKKYL
jgi:predicted GNAT family N-acyltransferase